MCAHMGVMSGTKKSFWNDDFLSNAFTTSMLRGEDSSGLVCINTDTSEYELHKLPVAGNFFAKDKVAERMFRDANAASTISIGHVRAATVGKINMNNAHPFIVEHNDRLLMGAHNGTLTNWKTKPGANSFDVDSEWALWHIACEGADAFEDFTGAFAFVWWNDQDPNHLYMARNSERTLAIAFLEDGGMAWASEAGMLYWLLERNRIKMVGSILELDEDKLYKFPVGDAGKFTKSNLPKPQTASTYNYGNYYSRNTSTTYSLTTVDKVQAIIDKAKKQESKQLSVVLNTEQQEAEKLGLLGEKVLFDPMGYHGNGYIEGMGTVMDAEFECVIRHECEKFNWTHTWECYVEGLTDDDGEIVLILSAPKRSITALSEVDWSND